MPAGFWTAAAAPTKAHRTSQSISLAPAEVRQPRLTVCGTNQYLARHKLLT